ncbi:MAG: TlpA disulfide reductase family protein [Mobilicoccus sp.]|nr:TlpA disulfide reductase family protein [Mobilicoccus sp.]
MTSRSSLSKAVAALATTLVLAACTAGGGGNTVGDQARQVPDRSYISGDGRVETLGVEQRGEPVELTGTTLDGQQWSSVDQRGDLVVVNVWGSWCPPCVEEMPELESAYETLTERDVPVHFMGVNVNESAVNARAFIERVGTSYPSLEDDGGTSLIALQEKASTPPTTLVLDREGRIAARVAGQVDASTLVGLVDDVAAS